MADGQQSRLQRAKETIDWARRIQWVWLLLPSGWKAYLVAACLGLASLIAAKMRGLSLPLLAIIVLLTVALTLVLWSVFERKAITSKDASPPASLKERTLQLADELLEFLRKQGPQPPTPLSVKGNMEEQRHAFNAYFDWQKDTYFKYMAHYKDRVFKTDYELAAEKVFTKLEERDINPPNTSQEVGVRKTAEALLLAATQLPRQNKGKLEPSDPQILLEYHWRHFSDQGFPDKGDMPVTVRNAGSDAALSIQIEEIKTGGWQAAFPPISHLVGGEHTSIRASVNYDGMQIPMIKNNLIALLRPSENAGTTESRITKATATYKNVRGEVFECEYEFRWDHEERECKTFVVAVSKRFR